MLRPTKKPVITVGRMWGDNVHTKFVDSLVEMILYTQAHVCDEDEYVHYEWGGCSWHSLGRNNLVEGMRGDWLLQLDTDHMFAPDLLKRMFNLVAKHPDIKVLSGIYQSKHPPHNPVMGLWSKEMKVVPVLNWTREAELIQVGAVGAGCLLVKREVFKRITTELGENPFDILPGLSEDYSFCLRCHELDIPVFVAPKIECHHLVTTPLSIADFGNLPGVQIKSQNGVLTLPD